MLHIFCVKVLKKLIFAGLNQFKIMPLSINNLRKYLKNYLKLHFICLFSQLDHFCGFI